MLLKKKLAVVVFGALMFNPIILPPNNFLPTPVVHAEIRTIEADGYYIMGDGTEENQAVAKERARENAKRAASEQACTFIESVSEVKNGNLTRDEIRSFSATVLKVIDSNVKLEANGDSIVFHCYIKAEVDTSNVHKLLQDRQKLNELLRQNKEQSDQIAKLNAEMAALKEKYKNASAEQKKEINAEIKRNEEQFTAIQWIEKGDGYYREALQFQLEAIFEQGFGSLEKKEFTTLPSEIYDKAIENYSKAIECYNKAIKLNPNDGYVYEDLGVTYKSLGECYYQKTIEYLNKMIKLNPDNDYAWYIMGNVHYKFERYHDAIKCYDKAIELNPKNDEIWNNLGDAYDLLGNYDKAVECYDKALELNPKNRLYRHFKRQK